MPTHPAPTGAARSVAEPGPTPPVHSLTAASIAVMLALFTNWVSGAFDRHNPPSSASAQVTLTYYTQHQFAGWANVTTSALAMTALYVWAITLMKMVKPLSVRANRQLEMFLTLMWVGVVATSALGLTRMALTINGLLTARTAQVIGQSADTSSQAAVTQIANHYVNAMDVGLFFSLALVVAAVTCLALTRKGLSVRLRWGYWFVTLALVISTAWWGSFGFGIWVAVTGIWLAHAHLQPAHRRRRRRPLIR